MIGVAQRGKIRNLNDDTHSANSFYTTTINVPFDLLRSSSFE